MRTGIIGDVHNDIAALHRTLDGPLAGCDRFIAVGDILDRGPDLPADTFAALHEIGATLLLGNHELAYVGGPVYQNMREISGKAYASEIRSLIIDGKMKAATTVGDVLCVHGGITLQFWHSHLRESCGDDVSCIAAQLNRWLLQAVAKNNFSHPVFASLIDHVRGPFWAHAIDDVVRPGMPPFKQVVGHTISDEHTWIGEGKSQLFTVDWGPQKDAGPLGHVIVSD